jgi:hypothetical protein
LLLVDCVLPSYKITDKTGKMIDDWRLFRSNIDAERINSLHYQFNNNIYYKKFIFIKLIICKILIEFFNISKKPKDYGLVL